MAVVARRTSLSLAASLVTVAGASTGASVAGLRALVRPKPSRSTAAAVEAVGVCLDGVEGEGPLQTPDGCDTLVEVRGTDATCPGFWGLTGDDGSRLLVGPPLSQRRGRAVRPAVALGTMPRPGTRVVLDARPWGRDAALLGLTAVERHVAGPAGLLPVTEIVDQEAPRPDRAVVFVHGRSAVRDDGMWFAPTAAAAGWRTVLAGYRNDTDACATGRYLLGGEWEDLAAVVASLRDDGVAEIVLVGWSMGGNICASYLRHVFDPLVVGLVLDAPALDWQAVLTHVARGRRLPTPLVPAVMGLGRVLEGIDWRRLDHLSDTDHLALPTLAFHGTADETVPESCSQALADGLEDVDLHLFDGAGHCRSMQADPGRYLSLFGAFLTRVGAVTAAAV